MKQYQSSCECNCPHPISFDAAVGKLFTNTHSTGSRLLHKTERAYFLLSRTALKNPSIEKTILLHIRIDNSRACVWFEQVQNLAVSNFFQNSVHWKIDLRNHSFWALGRSIVQVACIYTHKSTMSLQRRQEKCTSLWNWRLKHKQGKLNRKKTSPGN